MFGLNSFDLYCGDGEAIFLVSLSCCDLENCQLPIDNCDNSDNKSRPLCFNCN